MWAMKSLGYRPDRNMCLKKWAASSFVINSCIRFSLSCVYFYACRRQLEGSEIDEDEIMVSESEDSNESWTTEEFSSEFIMRYGSRSSAPNGSNEKPFACPVPGCKKRYKNVNGIKYHSKNGHKKDGKWVNDCSSHFNHQCLSFCYAHMTHVCLALWICVF